MKGTRAILALSAFVAFPAFAQDAAPSTAAATPSTASAAPATAPGKAKAVKKPASKAPAGSANMIVTKDPETGELRPATAAERQQLLGRQPLAAPEHRVVTLPDGSVMVELGEADMSYAVATRGADGSIVKGCVHGKDAAKKAASPAATAVPERAPATDR